MKIRPEASGIITGPDEDHVPLLSRPWFIGLLLATVTFGTFWPVTGFPFVEYGDPDFVATNPEVREGITRAGVSWAFQVHEGTLWHPLTWISHMADANLFGTEASGPHLVNLGLHIATSLLLLRFLWRATRKLWRSGLVAGLFALHPLHVESVAWVAQRRDVLSGLFALLTLVAYERYARARSASASPGAGAAARGDLESEDAAPPRSSWFYYALALVCFTLGLLSKPMLVSLPLLLLLLDYWPLRRLTPGSAGAAAPRRWPLIQEKLPFVVLAVSVAALTLASTPFGTAGAPIQRFSLAARAGNAVVSYGRYLGKTFFPAHLSPLYPQPGHWSTTGVAAATALLTGLCLLAVAGRRRNPAVLAGWSWFVIGLLPVIGLVQITEQAMADRYMYLPSIGLFAALVWFAAEESERRGLSLATTTVGAGLALGVCLICTAGQVSVWRDTESLMRQALSVSPGDPAAVRLLALHFYNLGNAAKDAGLPEEAVARYRQALKWDPRNGLAHNNLGMVLQNAGRMSEALPEYIKAVELGPNNPNARNNLGVAYSAGGNLEEAVRQLTESIRLDPGSAEARNNLGAVFFRQNKFKEAVDEYNEAVRLAPQSATMYDNLADALARLGRIEEARAGYKKALQLNPEDRVAAKRLEGLTPGATPAK